MAKSGKAKNTQNKAKHSKLMDKKKKKLRETKEATKTKLKELNRKIHQQDNSAEE